jgi:hypothetical protein
MVNCLLDGAYLFGDDPPFFVKTLNETRSIWDKYTESPSNGNDAKPTSSAGNRRRSPPKRSAETGWRTAWCAEYRRRDP